MLNVKNFKKNYIKFFEKLLTYKPLKQKLNGLPKKPMDCQTKIWIKSNLQKWVTRK